MKVELAIVWVIGTAIIWGLLAREEYRPDHYQMRATGEGPWETTLLAGVFMAAAGAALIMALAQ